MVISHSLLLDDGLTHCFCTSCHNQCYFYTCLQVDYLPVWKFDFSKNFWYSNLIDARMNITPEPCSIGTLHTPQNAVTNVIHLLWKFEIRVFDFYALFIKGYSIIDFENCLKSIIISVEQKGPPQAPIF